MGFGRAAVALAAAVVCAQAVTAQDTTYRTRDPRDTSVMTGMTGMQWMDSMNARLDSLVSRMNGATGDRKVAAMAEVINELVAQRKAMRARSPRLMERRPMMPGGRRGLPPGHPPVPTDSPPRSPADTAP